MVLQVQLVVVMIPSHLRGVAVEYTGGGSGEGD